MEIALCLATTNIHLYCNEGGGTHYKAYTASTNTIRSFFCGKKEPKKATVKRYTARLTDTSLCNDGTTVA